MIYRFKNSMKCLLPALLLAAGLAGCVREADLGITPGGPDDGAGSDEVTITVGIPGTQNPSTRSIAGDGGEAYVKEIDILVFENEGAGEKLSQHVTITGKKVTNAVNSGLTEADLGRYTVQFKAKLETNAAAKTVVVVANAADAVGTPGLNTPKADVLAALTYASANDPTDGYKWNANAANAVDPETGKPAAGVHYTPIPMYGEYDVTKNGNTSGITAGMKMDDILLTRMLARIDIKNNDNAFGLQDVYVVNYNTAGYIAPAWNTSTGAILKAGDSGYPYDDNSAPSLPAAPGTQVGEAAAMHYDYANDYPAGITGGIYTYEAAATTGIGNTAGHTGAVCLIVYGTYNGSGYWYRMDFTSGTDAAGKAPGEAGFNPETVEYMPLYRNHRYSFEIKRVDGPGYGSFGDALASLGIRNNLKATMMVVDESGVLDYVYDGNYYLGTSGAAELGYAANSTATATVTTSYFGGWQIDTGKGAGGIEYTGTDTGWLTAVKTGSAGDQKSKLTLTAITRAGSDDRGAVIHLKAGNLRHSIPVTQQADPL